MRNTRLPPTLSLAVALLALPAASFSARAQSQAHDPIQPGTLPEHREPAPQPSADPGTMLERPGPFQQPGTAPTSRPEPEPLKTPVE